MEVHYSIDMAQQVQQKDSIVECIFYAFNRFTTLVTQVQFTSWPQGSVGYLGFVVKQYHTKYVLNVYVYRVIVTIQVTYLTDEAFMLARGLIQLSPWFITSLKFMA